MQRHNIGIHQQLRQSHILRAQTLAHRIGKRIMGLQLTPESRHDFCNHGADLSRADNADRTAMQIEAQ